MNKIFSLIAGLALLTASCGRKPSTSSAATDLEKAFQTSAPKPSAAPAAPAPTSAAQDDELKQSVRQAVSAIRTNGYAEAFLTLRAIQASPRITLDQYSSIESARLAVEREMASKAAAGDPAALKALERIKNAGH